MQYLPPELALPAFSLPLY
ncbi:hypothetical protein YPPY64_2928, partial [Yersinia pestis PY-64]